MDQVTIIALKARLCSVVSSKLLSGCKEPRLSTECLSDKSGYFQPLLFYLHVEKMIALQGSGNAGFL